FYVNYCLPRKIALSLQSARNSSIAGEVGLLVQTLCPDWLTTLALYATGLSLSAWLAWVLHFSWSADSPQSFQFPAVWAWVVVPQALLLLLTRQCHVVLDFFSTADVRRSVETLGLALFVQIGLGLCLGGKLGFDIGFLGVDWVLSLGMICGMRLGIHAWRKPKPHSCKPRADGSRRLAFIGAGAWDAW